MRSFGRSIGTAAALVVGSLACGESQGRRDARRVAAAATDPRQCALPGLDGLAPDTAAVRCAEAFIARNGYTDAVLVVDSAQIATEEAELAPSAATLLARRRNTLAGTAALICSGARRGRERSPGFTVAFLPPGDTTAAFARAVTMDTAFAQLRVEHATLLPRAVLRDPAACHPLGGLPRSLRGGTAT